ncbi:hypothetical protein TSUD_418330, partial [Trifolium subterraneum]
VTFDIKNTVINALKENQYSGAESQCPNLHLSHFYDACDYTDPPGISESDKRLRLFKFSLTGRAKDWLDTIPPGTIATWQDLERKFKDRYFPIHKFLERRSEIMNFEQGDSETLYDAWERFKLCLKKCPDHGIDELQQMQYFTQGLRPQTRMLLDASAGGSLKNKDEVEAKELVETMAQNEYRAQNDRGAKKKAGILELDTNNVILAQMKLMSKEMEELKKASSRGSQASVNQFEEALEQMPLYSKFLKELLTKKRKPLDDDTVDMTEECSALIQRKLPQKKKDPGSFTIPCSIGNLCIGRALCDLGSSINLMSLTMMKKIPGAVAKPTRMQLSLADRSIVYPYGILHDVLVRVGEFVFPADFIIMDMAEDREVESLLLGRPFLATGRALIDVEMGELMLRTEEEKIMFNVFEAMKRHDDGDDCFRVDVIEEVVEDVQVEEQPSPPLERIIVNSIEEVEDEFEEEIEECLRQLEANLVDSNPKVEEAVSNEKEEVAQEDKVKAVELKELPSHLKYVFLGENGSNPAIISSSLARLEESKLLRVLRANKEAMGWTISDLKGISPTLCMHKINMEDEYKPVVQPQRRLNPTMKEVVKKEVLKLQEAGMIYPISDSEWVSPVHVVPKKGGMTVIRNDKNELIPTRTVTGWRMCIDYRCLNKATRKDHYPLPFMDQMLERL